MYIDTISVQMQSKMFDSMGTIAEAGVVVGDNDAGIRDGYYYVAIYYGNFNGERHLVYTVTLESMREYLYGIYCEDEPPCFIERYDSVEEIEQSDFVEVFHRILKFVDMAGERIG